MYLKDKTAVVTEANILTEYEKIKLKVIRRGKRNKLHPRAVLIQTVLWKNCSKKNLARSSLKWTNGANQACKYETTEN